MNQTQTSGIQAFLKAEFEKRCKRNSQYSLRSYARDLGFSAQRLSFVINGKRGISREAGELVAKKLGLSSKETEYFLDLIDSEFSRSKTVKTAAQKKVKLQKKKDQNLELDQFKVISHWTHLAILTLLETKDVYVNEHQIAKAMGISSSQAKFALERLLNLGMATQLESGRYISTNEFFIHGNDIPNEYIKQFHEQMLLKSHEAIRSVGVDERDVSHLFLAVDPKDFSEAKKFITEFREEFDRRFSNSETNKKLVYALGIQFYKLSHPNDLGVKNEVP